MARRGEPGVILRQPGDRCPADPPVPAAWKGQQTDTERKEADTKLRTDSGGEGEGDIGNSGFSPCESPTPARRITDNSHNNNFNP